VDVPGSLIINSIFNVLRNGCAIHVDAREGGVNLSVKKLGTDLVIRVVDNGIGLSGNQLDPENEKFIFNKGKQKSRRGSTGLGLAHLDKRMERGGGMIRVASRKRGQTVDEMHTYPTKIDEREWKILKKLYKQVITQLYLNGACLLRKKN
jgi:signal transduction histidine kinase